MANTSELRPQWIIFIESFLKSGNKAAAYKAAYPNVTTDGSASASASKLLKNPKIKAYLDERLADSAESKIATANEVLEYYTRVMRGQERDQFGLDPSLSDRTKAAVELDKRLNAAKNSGSGLPLSLIVTPVYGTPDDEDESE